MTKIRKQRLIALLFLIIILISTASVFAADTAGTGGSATNTGSSSSTPAADPSAKKFRFVVIPDTHVKHGKGGVMAPVTKATEKIKELKPSFALHTGDMIDIKQISDVKSQGVEAMWSMFDKVMVKPLLESNIAFFPSPGNHDTHASVSKYKARWQQHQNLGFKVSGPEGYSSWYSFDFGDTHFISLWTRGSRFLRQKKPQMEWLEQDLAAAKQRGKTKFVVFTHSPILCSNKRKDRCKEGAFFLDEKKLFELLKQYNAVIFAGHFHVIDIKVKDGVTEYIDGQLGGGGGSYHFLVVDVDGPDIKVHTLKWPNFDSSSLPAIGQVSVGRFAGASTPGAVTCPPGYTVSSGLTSGTGSPVQFASGTQGTTPTQAGPTNAAAAALSSGKGVGCQPNTKVAVLGDSITFHGTRLPKQTGFVDRLNAHCGGSTKFDNRLAKPGETTAYMLKVLKSDIIGKGYKQLIIMGGVNDARYGKKSTEMISNLREIYALAKKDGMTVIAMTITPMKGDDKWNKKNSWSEADQKELEAVNSFILSKPPGVDVVINTYKALGDPANPQMMLRRNHNGDYLHPGPTGHGVMFNVLSSVAFQKAPKV